MSKNSFYFSHDNNARNDEKILAVRMELGAEGYGIYFMLLEKLLETENYILIKDYNRLAFDLRVSSEKIKKVIENFGLFQFTDDGKLFYSESLLRRMQPLDNLRKQRSEAGKKSAEKRQRVRENTPSLQENSTTAERPLQENSTEKVKERKVNVLLEKEPKERENIGEDNFSENSKNSEPLNNEEETLSKSCEKKFSLIWNAFTGKKNDIEKDFKKFQEKTKGLEIDFDKLLREATKSKNIYFQSWLNDLFPKATKKEKVFTPPTIQEVQDYCTERQNGIDAEIFWNFYQSKGWMVGKNKMKDWKSCVITWEKSRKKENADNRNHYNRGKPANTNKINGRTNPFTIDDFKIS